MAIVEKIIFRIERKIRWIYSLKFIRLGNKIIINILKIYKKKQKEAKRSKKKQKEAKKKQKEENMRKNEENIRKNEENDYFRLLAVD